MAPINRTRDFVSHPGEWPRGTRIAFIVCLSVLVACVAIGLIGLILLRRRRIMKQRRQSGSSIVPFDDVVPRGPTIPLRVLSRMGKSRDKTAKDATSEPNHSTAQPKKPILKKRSQSSEPLDSGPTTYGNVLMRCRKLFLGISNLSRKKPTDILYTTPTTYGVDSGSVASKTYPEVNWDGFDSIKTHTTHGACEHEPRKHRARPTLASILESPLFHKMTNTAASVEDKDASPFSSVRGLAPASTRSTRSIRSSNKKDTHNSFTVASTGISESSPSLGCRALLSTPSDSPTSSRTKPQPQALAQEIKPSFAQLKSPIKSTFDPIEGRARPAFVINIEEAFDGLARKGSMGFTTVDLGPVAADKSQQLSTGSLM